MAKKKKELIIAKEEPMTPLQKGILGAFVSFIPFFLIILLPMLVRNHVLSTMNIPQELLLATPVHINLVKTGRPAPTMRIRLRQFELQIPQEMTPVELSQEHIVFRKQPRRMSRSIAFASFDKAKPLDLSATGAVGWFVPSTLLRFFESVLYATWHPARVLCKANFIVSQGINSDIFETTWEDNSLKTFIFPISGNGGYLGRIFRLDGPEYCELSCNDEVDPVTLRGWVDIASEMKYVPPDNGPLARIDNGMSLATALQMAGTINENQSQAIERSLNQYYATGSGSWILPVVAALETRGFYREMIEFIRIFSPSAKNDPNLQFHWNEFRDKAVHHALKMDIDPHLHLNKLVGHCQNLGEFSLRKIKLTITLNQAGGNDRSFRTEIFPDSPLYAGQDKTIEIVPPAGIQVHNASGVNWRVDDVEVKD